MVTGYATPPVPPLGIGPVLAEPLSCDGRYQSRGVRVPRFQDAMSVDGVAGLFNITVSKDIAVRQGVVRDVVLRAFGVIALLVVSVALVGLRTERRTEAKVRYRFRFFKCHRHRSV